jgi:hypothetical protein
LSQAGTQLKAPQNSTKGWAILGLAILALILAIGLASSYSPFYALAGALAAAVGGLLFVRPRLGTYLVILSFPFLANVPRGTPIPGLKLDEVLIIISAIYYLIGPSTRKGFRFSAIDYLYWAMFLAGSIIPVLGVLARGQSPDWFGLVALLKQYILYRLIVMTLNERKHIARAVTLLLLTSLPVTVLAFMQLQDVAGVRSLLATIYKSSAQYVLSADVRRDFFRATATLGNWNALGGYAAFGACVGLAVIRYYKALEKPWLGPLALAANLATLMMAFSSSSIVGFGVGAFVWWILRARKTKLTKRQLLYVVIIVIIGSAAFLMAGKITLQLQFKRQTSSQVLDLATGKIYPTYGVPSSVVVRWALSRYLFGLMAEDGLALMTGFGTGDNAIARLPFGTAESGYVTMLFFYGPLFVLAYLALLWVVLKQANRIRRCLGEEDELGLVVTTAVISITIAMAVMNIIHPYYSAAGVTHYYWTVVGCMMVLPKLYKGTQQVPNKMPARFSDQRSAETAYERA